MDEPKLFPDQPQQNRHKRQEPQQSNINKSVTALGSRLRVLEEQYSTLRNKSQLTDSSLIDFEKDLRSEIRSMNEDVMEIKRALSELKDKIKMIDSELDNAVSEHEFKIIEKYVDIWDPSRFITKDQLREILGKEK